MSTKEQDNGVVGVCTGKHVLHGADNSRLAGLAVQQHGDTGITIRLENATDCLGIVVAYAEVVACAGIVSYPNTYNVCLRVYMAYPEQKYN